MIHASGFEQNDIQTSKCMQTKFCCVSSQLSPHFSSPSSPLNLLLRPTFSISPAPFAIPSTPRRLSSRPTKQEVGPESDRLPLAGRQSLLLLCDRLNSCTTRSRDICVYIQTKTSPSQRSFYFLLPSFHATIKHGCCFAPTQPPRGGGDSKIKILLYFKQPGCLQYVMNTNIFSCSSPS